MHIFSIIIDKMELTLCGKGHCPMVKSVDDGVHIGEGHNIMKLKKDEWNILVDGIKSGKLHKL